MANNRYYLKLRNEQQTIVDGGVDQPDQKTLTITFYNEDRYSFNDVKEMFSNLREEGIVIWFCIVQDDGTETDEMLSTSNKEFVKLKGIEYQMDLDLWKVSMTIPDETQERLKALEEAKPALISAFTENAEPTGVASRYYEEGELIAIYDENDQPITVKAIQPISYKHPLIIGLNCEKYYGGNE